MNKHALTQTFAYSRCTSVPDFIKRGSAFTQVVLVAALMLMLPSVATAQECDCAHTYEWLKDTFENNDAGFQYVIDKKGKVAYAQHCDAYEAKAGTIRSKPECAALMEEWLKFFRSGHVLFRMNADKKQDEGSNEADGGKASKAVAWETVAFNDTAFARHAAGLSNPGYEGLWEMGPYSIGIIRNGDTYTGFIYDKGAGDWKRSQVKLKIRIEHGRPVGTLFLRDRSARHIREVCRIGDNYLQMDDFYLKRVLPKLPAQQAADEHVRLMSTETPLFSMMDAKTAYLRIPSFDDSEKAAIDSIISLNFSTITSTEKLIIDVRNNGGGSDISYAKLLPLIYTNPVRTVGAEFRSTPLNNKRMDELAKNPNLPASFHQWAKESKALLDAHLNEFVLLDSSSVDITRFDTVYSLPKHVGIIINEGNGSTTEQFLLAAKQSTKVKLYGTTTLGVLDISNVHIITSPCEDYVLGYSCSRSKRLPYFAIDDKGIQPDFFIDSSIPKYEWPNFVRATLNEGK